MTPKSQWLSTKKRVYFSFLLQSDAGLGNGEGSSVHSFVQGSQALSVMWRSCLQHVASRIIIEWEEGMRAAWETVWVQPGNGTHGFCFDSIAQNSLSWHQFNCKEAGKCSKFLFSRSCARRRMLMVNTGGLCHRQGEWLSLLGMGGVGSGVCLGLGWECTLRKHPGKEADAGRRACMVHTSVLCSFITLPCFPFSWPFSR